MKIKIGEIEFEVDQVKEALALNKEKPEIISLFDELHPRPELTADDVKPFLETKEGKDLIQPYGDKRATDAINTWKKGAGEQEFKARLAAEILKLNPGETPEQKQYRELNEKFETAEKERASERLQGLIKELAFNEKVDPKFISGVKLGSIEEAALYIKDFKAELEKAKLDKANELMANGSYKPQSGGTKKDKIDLSTLSQEQMNELEMKGELDALLV